MNDIDKFFDSVDLIRARRARELSELKHRFPADTSRDPMRLNSKAVAVLSYAHWEGFFNDCTKNYIEFLKITKKKVKDLDWMLLFGALRAEFDSLRDKNHSQQARFKFISDLKNRLECEYDSVDASLIQAQSNLDFERLSFSFQILSFDLNPLQQYRLRIDKELVGWRHGVAHGDSPDLSNMDIAGHVDFTSSLLMIISDRFQHAILDRVN